MPRKRRQSSAPQPPSSAPAATAAAPPRPTVAVATASLGRRLGALLYDGLLIGGIAMLATFVPVIATNAPLPRAAGLAILLGSAVLFCSYFWVRHGRTLGMQAWRLRLASTTGGPVTISQALARYLVVLPGVLLLQGGELFPALIIFGLLYFQAAYLWALFNAERATWADLLSKTRVVRVD